MFRAKWWQKFAPNLRSDLVGVLEGAGQPVPQDLEIYRWKLGETVHPFSSSLGHQNFARTNESEKWTDPDPWIFVLGKNWCCMSGQNISMAQGWKGLKFKESDGSSFYLVKLLRDLGWRSCSSWRFRQSSLRLFSKFTFKTLLWKILR